MRLIDADELQYSQRYARADPDSDKLVPVYAIDRRQVNNAPTVDAEPVVRCRECVSYGVDEYGDIRCNDPRGLDFPGDNDFCSRGIRRE